MNPIQRVFATALPVVLTAACAGAPDQASTQKTEAPVATTPVAQQPAEEAPPEARPGLGFMPDYQAEVRGVRVGGVREGSPADLAGIEEGDVLIELAGLPVEDAQSYTEALDEQIIGKTITVRVRRGEAMVDLQVLVGSRTSH